MRILFVANGFPPNENGGVETYTYQLAKSLISRGHTVEVFCRHSASHLPDFEIISEDIADIHITRLVNDFKDIDRLERTYREPVVERLFEEFLDQKQFDLIHYNQLIGLSSRLPQISSERGIPAIYTLHDYWPFCARINLIDWRSRICPGIKQGADCLACMTGGQPGWQMAVLRPLKRMIPFKFRQIMRRNILMQGSRLHILEMQAQDFEDRYQAYYTALDAVQRLLAPSDFVRRQYIDNGFPARRIEIVPLGVASPDDPNLLPAGAANRPLTFGYVGSLQPIKGVDLLIRAFTRLSNPNTRLLIFGPPEIAPPDYRRLLQRLARRDQRIRFMGGFSQAERSSVYAQLDVVVVPSRVSETFSLVAREALLHGRPVIAARVGALPEVIQPGENGELFTPNNQDDLTRCLLAFIQNPALIRQPIQISSETIPNLEQHASVIEQIYTETIAGFHPQ